ncbi:LINE-1 retrotransposable element ORF1 protein [Anabarilius grahami]|uniref:LINE-1 retrotransposable element ORF1 protein n=1 Tax=Anabarilius grahami TaxID=495550 RepID=A0A3N0XD62_ANAGA|nr:LINE-1 retrotransposable element ORF1 protein [Anabarilius grahami]
MPKPSASNKVRNTDDQVSGANAKASSPDTSEKLPDTAYAMCKEICKEMSESILQGVNARFDAFELKNWLRTTLRHRSKSWKPARSRRHNIKIVGIQEDEEEGKPTEFVSRLIPQLLGEEHFPHPVKVDRAHRSLQPKPAVGEKPRTILARIHHFKEKKLILRRGRMQPLEYKGKRVLIFPDYTTEVMSQRNAFRDVMQSLRKKGIKFTLRYPARLQIHQHGAKAPTVFKDPTEAARFAERCGGSSGE